MPIAQTAKYTPSHRSHRSVLVIGGKVDYTVRVGAEMRFPQIAVGASLERRGGRERRRYVRLRFVIYLTDI